MTDRSPIVPPALLRARTGELQNDDKDQIQLAAEKPFSPRPQQVNAAA
jgi:hypothetical protein